MCIWTCSVALRRRAFVKCLYVTRICYFIFIFHFHWIFIYVFFLKMVQYNANTHTWAMHSKKAWQLIWNFKILFKAQKRSTFDIATRALVANLFQIIDINLNLAKKRVNISFFYINFEHLHWIWRKQQQQQLQQSIESYKRHS